MGATHRLVAVFALALCFYVLHATLEAKGPTVSPLPTLRVAIPARSGFFLPVAANGGLRHSRGRYAYSEAGINVEFILADFSENASARRPGLAEALMRGDVDVAGITLDTLPILLTQVPDAKAFLLSGWSDGEDAILHRITGPPNPKTALTPLSPAFWLMHRRDLGPRTQGDVFSGSDALEQWNKPEAPAHIIGLGGADLSNFRLSDDIKSHRSSVNDGIAYLFVARDELFEGSKERKTALVNFGKGWLFNFIQPDDRSGMLPLFEAAMSASGPESISVLNGSQWAGLRENARAFGIQLNSQEQAKFEQVFKGAVEMWSQPMPGIGASLTNAVREKVGTKTWKSVLSNSVVNSLCEIQKICQDGPAGPCEARCERMSRNSIKHVYFGANDPTLRQDQIKVLIDWFAENVKDPATELSHRAPSGNDVACVCVEGHASEPNPRDTTNSDLSIRRAEAVLEVIRAQSRGLNIEKWVSFRMQGKGSGDPLQPSAAEEPVNRRVLVYVAP